MFKFPYTNLHELNLDWILEKVKTLVANNDEFNDKADYAVETADEAKTIAEQAAQATIPDGAVTTIKIADGAVTGNKIAQATIQTGNLSLGCVTNPYILDGAINSNKLDVTLQNASRIHDEVIPLTLANNNISSALNVRGNIATLVISASSLNMTTFNGNETAGSQVIPSSYRPSREVEASGVARAGTWATGNYFPFYASVSSGGSISIRGKVSDISTTEAVYVTITWCI